jgi:hypothetical protein
MIPRKAANKLLELTSTFKAVAVTGPRQSGKTTLVKSLFKKKPYVSLENPDMRQFALDDPNGFLKTYSDGAILDEVQRVPVLFSYLQEILDNSSQKGLFVLSGSNNFLSQENISQSLAGRLAYFNLLPFSFNELTQANLADGNTDAQMIKGFYPPVYDQNIPVKDWCPNYIRTYIDRDVRLIKNILDLSQFEKFVRLLAGRNGQELNLASLGVESGVDAKTAQSWISILESSFVIYLLKSHHENFNKTVVKRPKLYFYDTSIVCYLLGIQNETHLNTHPLRGAIFEGMVISELVKSRLHTGMPMNLYYWRDKTGREINVIVDEGEALIPIEIKSGATVSSDYFKNIRYWRNLSHATRAFVLYDGDTKQHRSDGTSVVPWREGLGIGL